MDNVGPHQVVILGAGTSGLSAAVALADRGIRPLVIDRGDQVGSSWRSRYDRLCLNTGRQFSHLPGRPYAEGTPTYPTRDQVIAHLEQHATAGGTDLRLSCSVERIERSADGWRVITSDDAIDAPQVVMATGYDHEPFVPEWPGRESWAGDLVHSSHYANPAAFAGRTVLVVGSGSSGLEIAFDLATGGADRVWLAVRTPPNIMLREGPLGLPGDVIAIPLHNSPIWIADAIARLGRRAAIGDLSEFGLPAPAEGVFARSERLGVAPAIVDREVIAAIRERAFDVVGAVESLDRDTVRLADGNTIRPEVLVCATGFKRGLATLVGHLGVLDERGRPTATGKAPAAPGLRFIGFVPRAAQIGYAAKQARHAAKAIAVELRPR
jgi:hypothetical protein